MPRELVRMLKIQSEQRKQPNGIHSGLSLLCAKSAEMMEDLDCRTSLAESISWANSNSSRDLLAINKENKQLKFLLSLYQKTINRIDDAFEYSNESTKDREIVHAILGDLTKDLRSTINRK